MSVIELAKLLSELSGQDIYAVNFPSFTKGNFVKLEILSGIVETGGVQDFNIQLMFKSENHPAKAEASAIDCINKLNMVTNKEFADGKYQLILLRVSTPQPIFVGETQTGEFIFSVDFRVLTTKI